MIVSRHRPLTVRDKGSFPAVGGAASDAHLPFASSAPEPRYSILGTSFPTTGAGRSSALAPMTPHPVPKVALARAFAAVVHFPTTACPSAPGPGNAPPQQTSATHNNQTASGF